MSDNGKHFDNPKFRDLYIELGIKNYYSSPAHPQSNGQAKVTIRTLEAALKTKLEDLKGKWVEYPPPPPPPPPPKCYGHTELCASQRLKRPYSLWPLALKK